MDSTTRPAEGAPATYAELAAQTEDSTYADVKRSAETYDASVLKYTTEEQN